MGTPVPPGEELERLLQAIREGRAADVALVVDARPDLADARDAAGISAVVLALYHGRQDIAAWLAARRRDLDVFEAASLGDTARLEPLLRASPELAKVVSPDGFTALALASFLGRLAAVRLLLEHGADPNSLNANHYTPLTGAVTGRHTEVVAELLRHGARADHRYGGGYTPLHSAAANGSEEIVRLLLRAGADRHARTDQGKAPRDLAADNGHTAVADLLETGSQ